VAEGGKDRALKNMLKLMKKGGATDDPEEAKRKGIKPIPKLDPEEGSTKGDT
jgi:hypothetical protein